MLLLIGSCPDKIRALLSSPQARDKNNQRIHRQAEGNNVQSGNYQHCFRLHDSVAMQTRSAFAVNYKLKPSERPPNGRRGGRPPCKGSHSTGFSQQGRFFSSLSLVPKKGGTFQPVLVLRFLNSFVENSHFQMENIFSMVFMTTLNFKDAYLPVPVHKDSQKLLQFL